MNIQNHQISYKFSFTQCDVCLKSIPFWDPYLNLGRLMQTKIDGTRGGDRFNIGKTVLTACQICMDKVALGCMDQRVNAPFLVIEQIGLPRSVLEAHGGSDKLLNAQSCSICDRDILAGDEYVRSTLHLEIHKGDRIEQKVSIDIAILCNMCSYEARKSIELPLGSSWIDRGTPSIASRVINDLEKLWE